MPTLKVKLLSHQLEFIQDTHTRFLAMCAGYGSGKTRSLIYKTIDLASLNVGTTAGLFSATHELATDILIPEMDEQLETLGIKHTFKASPHPRYILHFPHGSTEILVKSFENWKRIVGHNYSFAAVDEIDTVDPGIAKKAWDKLLGRIRVGKACQIATTSTPEGFRFMYRIWVKEAIDKQGKPKRDRRLIRARSTDNPFLNPEFIPSLMENYSPELVKAYVNGEFVNLTSGNVYSSFDRVLNNCHEQVEADDRLHIGMDFNVGKMAAIVHVLRFDMPRAIDEFMDLQDTPSMIQAIKARYAEHDERKLITIYPDASGGNASSKNASESDLSLLRQAGFSVVVNASNPSVKDRINAMNSAFCNANGDRRYLVNVLRCPRYTECLEQQIWKDGAPDKTQGLDHSCFAADTLVLTPSGYQKISEMPESGVVYSAYSKPVPYHSLGITKTLAKTVKVTLSSGKIYRCTPDHLFLTTDGWVPAQFLSKRQLCKTIQPSCQKTNKSSKAYRTTVETKEINTLSEYSRKPIQTSSTCIERCGSTIMGRYLKAIKSITRTKILPTTRSTILNCLQPKNTWLCTQKSADKQTQTAIWLKCVSGLSWLNLLQWFGMVQKRVESGTDSTRSLWFKKIKKHWSIKIARFAVNNSSQFSRLNSIATKNVEALPSQEIEESQESITRHEIALCAQSLSLPTSTLKREHALNLAVGDYVLSVEPDKDQDVYCMTVPYWGCFALDEGFLVSNCDSGGYFIVKLMPITAAPETAFAASVRSHSVASRFGGRR